MHAARNRVQLTGASDHLVSEAIYLDDPEGNGIEVYRDRLPEEWRWNGDRIQMATDRLDLDNLAAEAGNTRYAGAPDGLRVGHIHLRVGDLGATQQFYCDRSASIRPPGAAARCSCRPGRYHHHVGSNIWHSAGAGKRDDDRAGLSWFAIEARPRGTRCRARAAQGRGCAAREFRNGSRRAIRSEPGCAFQLDGHMASGHPPLEAIDGTPVLHLSRTRRRVDVGIETEIGTLLRIKSETLRATCPACGQVHEWKVRDAALPKAACINGNRVMPKFNARAWSSRRRRRTR